jgi:hypothetical protein
MQNAWGDSVEDDGSVIVKGIRIDPDVLRKNAVQPCAIGQCMAACCSTGVWLKAEEVPRILEWDRAVKACLPPDRQNELKWFLEGEPDENLSHELGTSTVQDPISPGRKCCVFLKPDRKCALQVVSEQNHLGWPGLKPYFCAIYPLFYEEGVMSMDDRVPDFGHATCQRFTIGSFAIYELYRDEAILILGEEGYRELCEMAAAKGR